LSFPYTAVSPAGESWWSRLSGTTLSASLNVASATASAAYDRLAALSYMTDCRATEWWDALTATRDTWEGA
jgi:hypothetical protein